MLRVYGALGLLVAILLGVTYFQGTKAGALKAELHTLTIERDSLRGELKLRKELLGVDTVRLVKQVVRWSTKAAQVDTQWLHDTVPVPVEVVREVVASADTTIKTCQRALNSCLGTLKVSEKLTTTETNSVKVLKKSRGMGVSEWIWRAASFGLGFVASDLHNTITR